MNRKIGNSVLRSYRVQPCKPWNLTFVILSSASGYNRQTRVCWHGTNKYVCWHGTNTGQNENDEKPAHNVSVCWHWTCWTCPGLSAGGRRRCESHWGHRVLHLLEWDNLSSVVTHWSKLSKRLHQEDIHSTRGGWDVFESLYLANVSCSYMPMDWLEMCSNFNFVLMLYHRWLLGTFSLFRYLHIILSTC